MKLISISSWQRHLFRRETLQWSSIGVRTSVDRLFAIYNLSSPIEVTVDPSGRLPVVLGAGGEFRFRDKRHTIENVTIDPVSVQFQVIGETAVADAFYEDLLRNIEATAETSIDRTATLARTIQTLTVAKMEIDPWRFYSKEWKQFLHSIVEPLVEVPDSTSHNVVPHSFSFLINYERVAKDYLLNPKGFAIEPRLGTNAGDSIFFSQSPTDSDTHLKLIEQLERDFPRTT